MSSVKSPNADKILGPEVGYTDLLDFAITEKLQGDMEAEKAGKARWHPLRPSAAGYCARRLGYQLQEYRGHAYYEKEPKSPPVYRLLELGHSVEFSALKNFQLVKVLQQRYRQQVLTFFEVSRGDNELKKELVEGSCDFVFWSEKYKAIGDVKSKKDNFSAAYKTSWDEELEWLGSFESLIQISETAFWAGDLDAFISELGDDFLTDNLFQLNLYACSDFMVQRGVDHAFLYRYNKNDSRHMEIRFRPSKKMARYVEAKFNKVSVNVDRGTIEAIPKEYHLGSKQCAFCPYKNQCWGDDDALKAHFNTLPKKYWPTDIPGDSWLAGALAKYEKALKVNDTVVRLEAAILKEMEKDKLKKIRLADGTVYETKYLKTPHPHLELRRSKA